MFLEFFWWKVLTWMDFADRYVFEIFLLDIDIFWIDFVFVKPRAVPLFFRLNVQTQTQLDNMLYYWFECQPNRYNLAFDVPTYVLTRNGPQNWQRYYRQTSRISHTK